MQEELAAELSALEDEALTDRLMGADHVPIHMPEGAVRADSELVFAVRLLYANEF
jgi:charged multivesicular body protein 4